MSAQRSHLLQKGSSAPWWTLPPEAAVVGTTSRVATKLVGAGETPDLVDLARDHRSQGWPDAGNAHEPIAQAVLAELSS